MSKQICVAVALCLALAAALQQPAPAAQTSAREFVIRDVRVFDGERVVPRTNVLVRDGSIASFR